MNNVQRVFDGGNPGLHMIGEVVNGGGGKMDGQGTYVCNLFV